MPEGSAVSDDFMETHFHERNVLGHVRFDARVDSRGRRGMLVAEFQSQWAQRGRVEGFTDNSRQRRLKEIVEQYLPGTDWHEANINKLAAAGAPAEVRNEFFSLLRSSGTGVPAAPFVGKTEAWVGLAMKR